MATRLRVLSYNIHAGIGVDGRFDLDRVANVIRGTEADVVGLQEVDRCYRSKTEYTDQIEHLSERLGMEFAYGTAIERPPIAESDGVSRRYGVAVLSRHPITDTETHPLSNGPETEQRVLLETCLDVRDVPWTFATTHLGLAEDVRRRQVTDVLDRLADRTERVLLTGDFNATPDSNAIDRLTERFRDAFADADLGDADTFPTSSIERNEHGAVEVFRKPARIDYVFYTPDLRLRDVELVESPASDHAGVVAALELDPGR